MAGGDHAPSRLRHAANAFTLGRVVVVPAIAVLARGEERARWWASALFALAAASDSMDGWLARRFFGVSRWGKLADPAADKALVIGVLAALASRRELPGWAVGLVAAREVAVTLQRSLLARQGLVMAASRWGKIKTIAQMVAIFAYLLPSVRRDIARRTLDVSMILTLVSWADYAWRGRAVADAG